ncbi:MAG: phosphoribosyl-ATP diphosphatase [Hyphomicrobiales bacterium]|nr:MAG: phosphoribosyl-ATP diphosphatase [Hyphomicrobiales bacterium]
MPQFSLTDLDTIIAKRADAGADSSYTAQLLHKGVLKCAEKLGEESIELILAAAAQEKSDVANEAADVLYHLLVLLRARDVPLEEVMTILEGRTGQSGLAEKALRG